jgi:hypothetical protein
MYAIKAHAHEMHAHEMYAHETHSREICAHEMHEIVRKVMKYCDTIWMKSAQGAGENYIR